ncbi:MAG TPA: hypothetical protein VHP83_01700 [Aggregatilineaceae bacterium]|nr:hypothetical protein [Aggregatilineaceae bacterium]
MDHFEQLKRITAGLNKRFPDGNDPFQIMTRLLEECGELAREVNHFAGSGVKCEKYGEPDRAHLAKEIRQVLTCALQVAAYYGVEAELQDAIESAYQQVKAEGLIED